MSMTDLKALVLSWVMGARKLPAAPALDTDPTSASSHDLYTVVARD